MPSPGHAQTSLSRYVIQLTDKKGSPYTLADPEAYLSAAAVQRRARRNIPIDPSDLPVSPVYLDSIGGVPNVELLNRSKWLNQVLIRTTDSAALARILGFPFVRQEQPAGAAAVSHVQTGHAAKGVQGVKVAAGGRLGVAGLRQGVAGVRQGAALGGVVAELGWQGGAGGDLIDYGNSYAQIHIHHGEYLHDRGFQGQGITIAVLDDGFYGYLSNPVFDSVRSNGQVLGSWDFVNNKQSVNEEDVHGMFCLSTMAANRPGLMVGSAPGAKFWLFKTEDINSEYPVEEQNWAAAAEFADSAGADMITTSLGYVNFDDPILDHSYAQRDGHTAISTRAANFAVGKGMIVLAAAGNSGTDTGDTKYIGCPADGDSVLTVGSIDKQGVIVSFSSWGPNASGRIKPDVVSLGEETTIAGTDGNPTTGSGTSFATPNMAGLAACLWEAYPEFPNYAILDAIRQSSSNFQTPDGRYGYGLPDLEKAFALLQAERGANAVISRGSPWITAFPVPYTDGLTVVFRAQHSGTTGLTLIDAIGRTIERQTLVTVTGQWYTVRFDGTTETAAGVYFVRYTDGQQQTVLPVLRK